MLEAHIINLINYAKLHLRLIHDDEIYIRNRLLETFNEDDYIIEIIKEEDLKEVKQLSSLEGIITSLVNYALIKGVITEEKIEHFTCKLLDIVSLKPSEVIKHFNKLYDESPLGAFNWLEKYNIANDYVKSRDIARNIHWYAEASKGKLEITINLSKPEKSNKDVKKLSKASGEKYPKCVICPENEGYGGGATTRQNLRGVPIFLNNEKWFWQFSPYAYFNQHGIAINYEHTPMKVDNDTVIKLLDFVDFIPDYFIGCNAALPIIGGSILSHDHFQGGYHKMPMHYARPKYNFKSKDYKDIDISTLDWYNNVIRLESTDRKNLEGLTQKIIQKWKTHDDLDNNIISKDVENHNSITLIARKDNGKYLIDLILRNNLTTEEHPGGLFHAHEEYHNIKSEGIGLIEAMGLFILPARLNRQMAEVKKYLMGKNYFAKSLGEEMVIHQTMIEKLLKEYGDNNNSIQTEIIIREEIARVCEAILDNTRVFKDTEAGNAGLKRFMEVLNLKEA